MKNHLLTATLILSLTASALTGCGTNNSNAAQQQTNASGSANNAAIGFSMDSAKKAALERVEGASENNLRINLEIDDGRQVYDGEIIYEQKEYDFEIDAATGEFLEWTEEYR